MHNTPFSNIAGRAYFSPRRLIIALAVISLISLCLGTCSLSLPLVTIVWLLPSLSIHQPFFLKSFIKSRRFIVSPLNTIIHTKHTLVKSFLKKQNIFLRGGDNISGSTLARRTEIKVKIAGVDITDDINKYLTSLTYTDNECDKTDDLQISLDDREGIWLENWLYGADDEPPTSTNTAEPKIGDVVEFLGGNHFVSSTATVPTGGNRTAGPARLTNIAKGVRQPFHVIGGAFSDVPGSSNVYGWVSEAQIQTLGEQSASGGYAGSAKGASISAVIIQKNFDSDGTDRILDCGDFTIDSLDGAGPPSTAAIKATSLPFTSTARTATQTRAWENIRLSSIAGEIASKCGMTLMYESSFNPLYDRKEQMDISDIVFLQGLCYNAGISLKAASGFIILFDAATYEQKPAVREIKRGESDVISYRFGTKTNDTKYACCHVSYTDPQTGRTIEYTYTLPNSDAGGQTLKINERVKTRDEARNLAIRRLRQKNKGEFQAEFTMVGDTRLVSGVCVEVIGWGMFDGKYIIETAGHTVGLGGYTTQLKSRRTLEGY
jgi:phage protein D